MQTYTCLSHHHTEGIIQVSFCWPEAGANVGQVALTSTEAQRELGIQILWLLYLECMGLPAYVPELPDVGNVGD